MNEEPRDLRDEELAFFGRVGADVTHDMRNVLSVIREYSGLLRDLISAATRKKPLDSEQLKKLSESITRQVRKGTELMERFSQFAHAADEQTASFDLTALTSNTAALAQRSVKLARCTLDLDLPQEPIPVRSNPLSLQHAVFSGIQLILESAGEGEAVAIRVARRAPAAVISIAGRAPADGPPPSDRIDPLSRRMKELNGSVETSSDQGTLSVKLTIPIDSGPA
ncbi:MAG: sensor histidine kinase [Planctomycetota bacterium]|jgi:signal transduction histidine kinase